MPQRTLCVPLEVKPESCSRLSTLIGEFRERKYPAGSGFADTYERIKIDVPPLHFMSMSVFPSASYDPIFILEANFDGEAGAFWGQIEAARRGAARDAALLQEAARRGRAALRAVTAPGSRAPVAPYFDARTQRPSVFHHGNRGLARDRILDDERFLAVREAIDPSGPSPYRALGSAEAHAALRTRLLPDFPWLDSKAPTRISIGERARDLGRLIAFAVVLLLVLSLPGLVLAPILPWRSYFIVMAAFALLIVFLVYTKRAARPGTGIAARFPWVIFRTLQHLLDPRGGGLCRRRDARCSSRRSSRPATSARGWGRPRAHIPRGLVAGCLGRAAEPCKRLRHRAAHRAVAALSGAAGSSHDAPPVDERTLREMVRREDWIAQNHMGSIVLIKPGILRGIIIRAGHLGLGGCSGSRRRTAISAACAPSISRTGRSSTTAAVCSSSAISIRAGTAISTISSRRRPGADHRVGLRSDSADALSHLRRAAHGRQFKNWALASRAVSRFWYSAYRELTVDQIERNHRIANGCAGPMSEQEATAWMRTCERAPARIGALEVDRPGQRADPRIGGERVWRAGNRTRPVSGAGRQGRCVDCRRCAWLDGARGGADHQCGAPGKERDVAPATSSGDRLPPGQVWRAWG